MTSETSIIWTVDESGRIAVAQPAWAACTGQNWDEHKVLGWINALHPEDRIRLTQVWDSARSAQAPCCWEGRLRHGASGTYRHFEGSFGPLPSAHGAAAREWALMARDVDDRKRDDTRLRESERRFHALFDSGPMAIFSCDRDGVVQDYNRQAAVLWGREPKRGDSTERYCGSLRLYQRDGTLLPHSESPIVRVLRTGTVFKDVEVFIERPDGTRIAVVVTFIPLKSESGEITGAITSFYDITERKRAEDALRASQARFEALFEAAPIGVYLVDAKFRIRQVNPKARPWFSGIDELIGRDFDEIADEVVGRFRHTLETGEPYFNPEFSEERNDSQTREYYDWQIHRIPLPSGQYGVVCYFQDISRLVLARTAIAESEAALRASEEFLRAAIDSSAGGFYGVARDGATTICNAAFLRMLGFERRDDAIGKKLHDVIHHSHPDGSHYPREQCPIYQTAQTGVAAHVKDELFFRLDGSSFPVEYWTLPIIRDGQIRGAVTTFIDITERTQA